MTAVGVEAAAAIGHGQRAALCCSVMEHALIAGCGYVGTALGMLLAGHGHRVFGMRRHVGELPESIEGIAADLGDPGTLRGLPSSVSWLIYTASPDAATDEAYRTTYVEGLRHCIDAVRATGATPRRLVLVSSTSVHGQTDGGWVTEDSATRDDHFTAARLLEAEAVARASGWPQTTLRFAGIYGPGREGLLRRIREGSARRPPAGTYSNRIHRDDCAAVIAHVLGLADPSALYLAGDREPTDHADLITYLATALGASIPPCMEAPAAGGRRSRSNKRICSDRLVDDGFRFAFPSYREGYADLIAAMGGPAATG